MTRQHSLSAAQARRIALVAQGFRDRPHAVPTMRTLDRTVRRTGLLQVDSVNVLARAHLMPLFSRMGPYDVDLLRRAAEQPPRRLVEYWAHVQALMPVELWPVMQHRMAHYRRQRGKWGSEGVTEALMASLRAEIAERGASTARELDEGLPRVKDQWGWNWSTTRRALDAMFSAGEVAIARRTSQFECVYDLPERVLPAAVLAAPTPTPAEAARELVRRAARSHGVGTEQCLRDYYRMGLAETRTAIAELVEDGELVTAVIEGWRRPAYLHRDVAERGLPRRVEACALLSPFDPLVWERERALRIFGFDYRIEIYVPEHKRVHGYYVLPFLLGERIVARVDLKADRRARLLVVKAAYAEPGAPPATGTALGAELRRLAGWLGLDDIVVHPRGDLAVTARG
ncbi:MAG: winged helix-turn-helix domain-containing protein [Marmoricola sp.]